MWKLTPAIAAATALHAAVWMGAQWHARPAAGPLRTQQVQSPDALHVRWVTAVPAAQARDLATAPPDPQVAPDTRPATVVAPDHDLTLPPLTAQRTATPPAAEPLAEPPIPDPTTPPMAVTPEAIDQAGGSPAPWWPRPQLTRPPVPQTVIQIDFPTGEPTPGRQRAVLALYIDDQGLVQRVDTSDAELPGPYITAARDAFLQARFAPGEIQGRAVKSLIHIEVNFHQDGVEALPGSAMSRHYAGTN